MSCIVLRNPTGAPIPIGTLVVPDGEFARPFDEEKDAVEDIIGVIYPTFDTSGRAFSTPDGPAFYEDDFYLWNQNLTLTEDSENYEGFEPNPDYVPFNPYSQTGEYCVVIYNGFVAVKKPYGELPARWKVLKDMDYFSWCLVR
jgi:hypothetical protein